MGRVPTTATIRSIGRAASWAARTGGRAPPPPPPPPPPPSPGDQERADGEKAAHGYCNRRRRVVSTPLGAGAGDIRGTPGAWSESAAARTSLARSSARRTPA